ncbi:hypothetical protein OIU78_011842 [Salix suchowensis]|nr:hypothetical protein OIU78_011842 [Salix suchowensis]
MSSVESKRANKDPKQILEEKFNRSGKKCTIQAWKQYIARSITMTSCKKIELGFGQQYSPSGDYN